VSEQEEELELQATQRELEDAFATTRPRAGFEDELWLRMQAQRPASNKIRDVFTGFWEGIRAVPMVPAAATAAVLVVAIGVGFLAYTGALQGPRGGSTAAGTSQFSGGSSLALRDGSFGRVPTPEFNPAIKGSATQPAAPAYFDHGAMPMPYYGPATLTWAGQLNITITSAPVFRYREPSVSTADAFAASLGAGLDDRSSGLGTYSARDYKLIVRGTIQSPPRSPVYLIVPTPLMPPVSAAGAGPIDVATVFLAEHSLAPQWPYTAVVQETNELTRVLFIRQFDAPGYPGPAKLIDSNGELYGLEVDLKGNAVQGVVGLLPVNLDTANYPIIAGDKAIQAALTPKQPAPSTPGPAVQLTKAELVYVLAPAGPQSFYEPAYLFSGTFQMGGATYEMRVMVPAVDPSQRS
jgi:hypothetical protein